MRRPGGAHRARPQGRDQPHQRLRPEELFLSGPAAGLSDLAVQAADRRRGRGDGRSARRHVVHRRHRAASPGAGRRQVDPRPGSDAQPRRSQPLGRRADGDRLQAGPPLGRGGARLSHQAADDPPLSRHLRRQHGGGLAPRRRQRLGAQARRSARHALRDQERQLDPLRRPGDREGSAPPDRHHRGRRHDRSGDAAVRSGEGRDAVDALQGRGARLPLFPRSGPPAAELHPGLGR